MQALDLRMMEELCQPTMNGWGGPIVLMNIQATDFGLKNHMVQQVQNSCQFHGLPSDDANKHLDKFLTVTQCMKQNGEMASKFLSKYFPPSMVTKLRNEISNFRQLPDESLFEAWECYKLSIDRCPNHNMLPVTQIDTIPQLIGGVSSGSTTSSSSKIAALAQQMIEMRKDMLQMYRSNQQVNSVTPSCESCGGPHSYYECQDAGGYTQDVYATTRNYNSCGNSYQLQGNSYILSYRSKKFLGPPGFNNQNQGAGPSVPLPPLSSSSKEVKRDPKTIMNQVLPESTTRVPPLVFQPSLISRSSELPSSLASASFVIPE
nr:hypothetical protein [Tanacetum cinerariifolium]